MWTRAATAAELRALTRVVWPIVVTQLSQMGMGVADTMMAGRVSAADLAGVTLGGNLYWPSMLLLSGIVMSITPSVSQLHGGGRTQESGEVVRQALWIALVGGAVTTWLLHNAEPVYHLIGVDPVAIPIASAYLAALSTGLLPLLGYMALRNLCDGLSWTLPAMCIGLSGLVLKVPLNALFIYGNESLGIEPMGGVGCGWATALVMFYQLAAMTTIVAFSRVRMARLFARFSWPDRREIMRLVRLGVPIGITMFVEVGFFSVVGLSVGALGVVQVASHQIAFNVAGIAFMVPLAMGVGATIRVGTNIGAGQIDGARLAGAVAMGVVGAWSLISAALILLLRHDVSELFSSDPEVIQVASRADGARCAFPVLRRCPGGRHRHAAGLQGHPRAGGHRRGGVLVHRPAGRRGALLRHGLAAGAWRRRLLVGRGDRPWHRRDVASHATVSALGRLGSHRRIQHALTARASLHPPATPSPL